MMPGDITKREYFAAAALQGFCTQTNGAARVAQLAMKAADELIGALNLNPIVGESHIQYTRLNRQQFCSGMKDIIVEEEPDGRFILHMGGQRCPITLEDMEKMFDWAQRVKGFK